MTRLIDIKQLVVLIFQSGAIKLLQKRLKQDDVIKSAPVKHQTVKNNVKNHNGNMAFMIVSCINMRKVSSSLHKNLIFLCL